MKFLTAFKNAWATLHRIPTDAKNKVVSNYNPIDLFMNYLLLLI